MTGIDELARKLLFALVIGFSVIFGSKFMNRLLTKV